MKSYFPRMKVRLVSVIQNSPKQHKNSQKREKLNGKYVGQDQENLSDLKL